MHVRLLDSLRAVVAVGVWTSAAVHLYVYLQGFSEIPVIGPLFLANVIGGALLGVAVAVWRHWIPAVLAAGFGLVTAAAYWFSVVHGLFGVREVTGGWPEIVAEAAEYAAIVFGGIVAIVLLRQRIPHTGRRPPRPAATADEQAVTQRRGLPPGRATPPGRTRR